MERRVAVIGGGLSGMTCALRLAGRGIETHLYEAAPELGGRTKSHFDRKVDEWVDNGPHLMIGAYEATQRLLADIVAGDNVTWQSTLRLPLHDLERGHFALAPSPWLPFSIALVRSIAGMPGHGIDSLQGMLRIALAVKKPVSGQVKAWLNSLELPPALIRDMLEPLCLGTMNESIEQADAASFAAVLNRAFDSHRSARLGWFNKPLSEALIAPLQRQLEGLGVTIHSSTTIRSIDRHDHYCRLQAGSGETTGFSHVVIALPAHARDRLLGITDRIETSPITNVHLWFDEGISLPEPLVGTVGSYSQWFFDISAQFGHRQRYSHICAVISAEKPGDRDETFDRVLSELSTLLGRKLPDPVHRKIVCEKHATVVVREGHRLLHQPMIIDASEAPESGQLPATIEVAVQRGEEAAAQL